jgi:hypothetical protein
LKGKNWPVSSTHRLLKEYLYPAKDQMVESFTSAYNLNRIAAANNLMNPTRLNPISKDS